MSSNYHIILQQILEDQQTELEIESSINRFFGNFSALQLLKNNELTYEEIEKGDVDGTLDGGIDNFYLFINGDLIDWTCFILDEDVELLNADSDALTTKSIKEKYKKNIEIELVIIQAKLENSFNETSILKLKDSLGNLLNLEVPLETYKSRYNTSLLTAFEVLRQVYLALIPRRCDLFVNIFYASKGSDVHPNVINQKNELEHLIESKLTNSKTNVEFIGAQKLIELYQKQQDIDFELNLVENTISNNASSYIGLTNIKELYNFITDDDKKLIKHIFESNVRDYQGKNNVNSDIADTLNNNISEDFWWLNNGVTILSTKVTPTSNKRLTIQNPEIVNGLQTSSEINRYFKENPNKLLSDSETRNVLVRIIVPSSEEVRDKIIKATNSQTQIPKSSLRATDPIHRQIETYLKPKGLFYDRRKNFYKNEGKKPKEIVSIPFMSQCLISAVMQKPDYARARPSTLLDDEDSYNKLFNNSTPLHVFYLLCFFGKRVEEEARNIDDLESNQSSDIKFHILYACIALMTKNAKPSVNVIETLDETSIDNVINQAIEITKKLYLQNGGNNKAAKSPKLKDDLIREVVQYF